VTPEARQHLDKAREHLGKARDLFDVLHYEDEAARCAYLAAFHASLAFISERTGTSPKTHRGTHIQFARLARDEPRIDEELRQFLPQSYDMKTVADYDVGPDAVVAPDKAAEAIETATRFVERLEQILAS
jgi:uncharacterized protein (UPF0332 family)